MQKIHLGILFGGRSAEHEISILSAKNILAALDTTKFEPILIGIDTHGGWHAVVSPDELAKIEPGKGAIDTKLLENCEVVFPVLHGPYGEDGTIQGLFEMAGIPYVGCGVLASALGMDKDLMKTVLCQAEIAVAPSMTLHKSDEPNYEEVVRKLGLPLFVKPANMGSSVGVNKVSQIEDLKAALEDAFRYDRKVLVETAIVGDEIECAVLGNEKPEASAIGRSIPQAEYYSYDAKYHDGGTTLLEIPAKIPEANAKKAQKLALEVYKVLGCEGMARVDMFLKAEGNIVVNEINTIPGFTNISMYPQLWGVSGLHYTDLITRLIELALERFKNKT